MDKQTGEDREYDLVVWGATGFTGRLVAEYLHGRYGAGEQLRWAIAGRNEAKLESLRTGLGAAPEALPILLGDSADEEALATIAARTRVICSTVGPFARYGSPLVAACAAAGTDYCDITGEVQWVRRMIDAHEERARATGARIVHCCGFDSIPSDLGTLFMNQSMEARHGSPCHEVKLRVRRMRGAFSGGTVASMMNALEEAKRDPAARRSMGNPYGLNPAGEQRGPDGPDQRGTVWDADVNSWTAPFVMAAVNTRVVRRSNALMDYAYGRDFRYNEAVMTGRGAAGWVRANSMTLALGGFMAAAYLTPTRAVLNKLFLPTPGEGPSEEDRENGFYDIVLVGKTDGAEPRVLRGRVKGDRDPGYGSTSRMLGESAVCLALDGAELDVGGGFWTPASAMGARLLARLENNAGLSFEIESD
jgi:short subunit dehydrogenase-like uncharacterized protein